ncbi:MAG TPA: asparagine synthase-related protein, partial [Armatimonadota bacterium]|nr:asparagine synthase-related protein [Armatimonadota bacterium]
LPGHTLSVTPRGLTEKPYWTLDPTKETRLGSDAEYAEFFRETFLEAVRCCMRTDGRVATMLSGGLDSSSITCATARLLSETPGAPPLRTLSALYEAVPESDERRYISTVLEMYRIEPSFFPADRVSPIAEIDRMNLRSGTANYHGNLYLNWNLYRTAASSGANVVLDGFDGDSTVSHGQGWLVELALAHRWYRLTRNVKASADRLGEEWRPAMRAWMLQFGVKPALRRLRALDPRRRGTAPAQDAGPALWARGLAPEFRHQLQQSAAPPRQQARTEREFHHGVLTRRVLRHTLDMLDTVAGEAGVEVRLPFCDVRLVEFCLSLPPQQKLRDGWSRYVMRQAMKGILPEEIRQRPTKSSIGP